MNNQTSNLFKEIINEFFEDLENDLTLERDIFSPLHKLFQEQEIPNTEAIKNALFSNKDSF